MDDTALLLALRTTGRVDDNDTDYTSARLRQELTDCLHQVFGHLIVQAQAGSWLKQFDITTTADRTRYRIPYRAMTGVGEAIEFVEGADRAYKIQGDQIVFETAPAANSLLRFEVYLRPSLITQTQTAGEVTAVDPDALTVTVNSAPTNRVTSATVASGDKVDIVHPNGWHELAVVNVAPSLSGSVFTFPSGTDLTDVEEGDFVRAADQTDWPCLPDDFHRALADMTAARVLRSRGYESKARALEKQCEGDLARFADILEPRIKNQTQTCVPSVGVLRSRFATRWPVGL